MITWDREYVLISEWSANLKGKIVFVSVPVLFLRERVVDKLWERRKSKMQKVFQLRHRGLCEAVGSAGDVKLEVVKSRVAYQEVLPANLDTSNLSVFWGEWAIYPE